MIKLTVGWAKFVARDNQYRWTAALGDIFRQYVVVNCLEMIIEKMIWGETFFHTFDYFINAFFVTLSVFVVWECYAKNAQRRSTAP